MPRSTKFHPGLFAVPLAIIAVAAWFLAGSDSPTTPPGDPRADPLSAAADSSHPTPAAPATPRPQVDPERPALRALPPPPSLTAMARSPIADRLNLATTTGAQDLAVVYALLDHYREAFGSFPTGEDNATIVNALTGNNPRRLAFIERAHSAISPRGELIDRWQTPLFFHMESRDAVEIRSAGPDREMYSGDDLRHASPGPHGTER